MALGSDSGRVGSLVDISIENVTDGPVTLEETHIPFRRVTEDGRKMLWAVPLESSGQEPAPVSEAGRWNITDIGVPGTLTVATRTDGTLGTWGTNDWSQLGDATTTDRAYPAQVGTDTNWKTGAAGRVSALAIRTDGTLWGWGRNQGELGLGLSGEVVVPTQVGTSTNWRTVDTGHDFALALRGP